MADVKTDEDKLKLLLHLARILFPEKDWVWTDIDVEQDVLFTAGTLLIRGEPK